MKKNLIKKALEISEKRDIKGAVVFQKSLQKYIRLDDIEGNSSLTAGIDISYGGGESFCSIVTVDSSAKELRIAEISFFSKKSNFPYIPGLLFFREFPVFFE